MYVVAALLLPVVGLVLTAFTQYLTPYVAPWDVLTTDHMRSVFDNPVFTRSVRNSLLIATIGGALATIAIAALVGRRTPVVVPVPALAAVPDALPAGDAGDRHRDGVLLGVRRARPVEHGARLAVGDRLAFAVRSLALGYIAFYPTLHALGEDLDRAARTSGADWWMTMRRIVLRLLRPAMAVSFILMFVAMINDYDPAVFLVKPGTEVMGATMLAQFVQGTVGPVAALAMVQVVITVVVLAIGRLLWGESTSA